MPDYGTFLAASVEDRRGAFLTTAARLAPTLDMLEPLARDYRAMSGMIFGDPPAFDDVMASVIALETRLNAAAKIEGNAA